MPKKMYATVLNYNTEGCQADTLVTRKKLIEDALRGSNTLITSKLSTSDIGRKVVNIFVAPEYTFANPSTTTTTDPATYGTSARAARCPSRSGSRA